MPNAVIVAEPEPSTRGFLERHLTDDGFDVLGAAACGEALELAERARPDLVLLGDTSALEACRAWSREVPLIVIGDPEADAVDRVRAFERGADDFLGRPFLYDELLARIRAVLRRTAPLSPSRVRVGEIEIDRPTRRVTVGEERVDLPAKEYELLLKLASEPSRVFTKEELLREVWGFRSLGRTRTLDSHASRLRRKLNAAGEGPFVLNVWGVGYRLLRDV
jgi:DNA-binding response OmpR family regulator